MGNVSSHTYTYAGKRSFACNCEENNGKCGLAPPNNRFERTHGTSPFAAQPNVRPTNHRRTLCLPTAANGGDPAGCMDQFRWPEIFRLPIESSIRAFGDFLHSQKGRDLSDFDS